MKRPRRPVLSCWAVVAAAILGAAWVTSAVAGNTVPLLPLWMGDRLRAFIGTERHSLVVYYSRELARDEMPADLRSTVRRHEWLGFRSACGDAGLWGASRLKGFTRIVQVGVPNALALPLILWFPLAYAQRSWRIRFRRRKRWCLNCGYDVRATPDRCPECGLGPSESCGPRAGFI